jgi:carboxyl-terminal processing protease
VRLGFLGAAALACLAFTALAQPESAALDERARANDFEALWRAVDNGYAYFGTQRPAWRRVREQWKPRAARARSRGEFVQVLEGAIAQLRDDNVTLSETSPAAARRVPAETDIWASWRGDVAVIEAVRTYGQADVAGLHPGHVVRSIGGLPVERAVQDLLGRGGEPPGARDWALRHALAGPRSGTLRVETAEARGTHSYEIVRDAGVAANGPPLVARRIGEDRNLGYIRVKAALSEPGLAAHFDGALHHLADTRGLILDLREMTGPFADPGRARANVLAIIGRFIAQPTPWQAREPRAGERVVDVAEPHAPRYAAPLVVLVDRWTAAEGEALAAGLSGAAQARLVGTRMAGLRGELREERLPASGIVLRYPAMKAMHANGTPREALRPDVLVDLAAPQGGPGDPILYQALKLLER